MAHGDRFQVLIRPKQGRRLTRIVSTEQEARDLVHHFNRLGMAGVDLAAALAEARADGRRIYPPLREVLPAFLDDQVALGDIRRSTRVYYRSALRQWVGYGPRAVNEPARLGDTPWNLVTREDIGGVLLAIRKAGRSWALLSHVSGPLGQFYRWQMQVHGWPGPNPAADLAIFTGKRPKRKKGDYQWIRRDELPNSSRPVGR